MQGQVRDSTRTRWPLAALVALVVATLAGCESRPSGEPYPIRGEVVSVTEERNEIVLRHEPIAGLMEAMTMPFPVAQREMLAGLAPGDQVEGVLLKHDRGIVLIKLAKREAPAQAAAAGL